jgi:hypothetical protein
MVYKPHASTDGCGVDDHLTAHLKHEQSRLVSVVLCKHGIIAQSARQFRSGIHAKLSDTCTRNSALLLVNTSPTYSPLRCQAATSSSATTPTHLRPQSITAVATAEPTCNCRFEQRAPHGLHSGAHRIASATTTPMHVNNVKCLFQKGRKVTLRTRDSCSHHRSPALPRFKLHGDTLERRATRYPNTRSHNVKQR